MFHHVPTLTVTWHEEARGPRLPGFLECTWKSHLPSLDSELADIQLQQEPQADDSWDVGVWWLFQRCQSEESTICWDSGAEISSERAELWARAWQDLREGGEGLGGEGRGEREREGEGESYIFWNTIKMSILIYGCLVFLNNSYFIIMKCPQSFLIMLCILILISNSSLLIFTVCVSYLCLCKYFSSVCVLTLMSISSR